MSNEVNVHEHYWAGCVKGEIRLQECISCGHLQFPPTSLHCPRCDADAWSWKVASGKGKVWSWVRFHQVYYKDMAEETPYLVAMIELDEGPLMISTVIDSDGSDLSLNAPVEVEFGTGREDRTVPKFRAVTA